MKKKTFYTFIIAAAIIGIVSAAQNNIFQKSLKSVGEEVYIGNPEKIVSGDTQFYMAPKWSPDGNYIAYTGSNHSGLWIINFKTRETRQITNENAAGYGYEWSPDSKAILIRVAKYDGLKRLNAVKLFFIETAQQKLLTDYKTFMPDLPHWTSNGEKVYLYDGKALDVFETGLSSSSLKKNNEQQKIVYTKNNKIFVGESSTQYTASFEPIKGKEYINLVTSPDGRKIAFEVYGGDLYTINMDGTGLVDLGKGYRPQWSADSKKIVFMITEDDGENYTSSDLYVINYDGTDKIQITKTDDALEMDPSWSPDGKYIAYHEMNEGSIYILPVNIP